MKRWLSWPRLIGYAIVLLLLAAWYVPRISADRYRDSIRVALQTALGRRVEFGAVNFRLLPLPGFTVSDVIIGEDPAIGAEPVAYVTSMRVRPRFSALFGGPLEFASVDLEEASLNLTRTDKDPVAVRWNFSSLMLPARAGRFPDVHLISGRVNFKFDDAKSVFYLLHTDIDLWPPSKADGAWTIRIHAEPARTDRPSRGFGSFVARGEWHPRDSGLVFDVKLEKSELGDMVTLFEGRESGLHGHIWGDAHLAGPLTRVGLAGRVLLDDIHGWNQTPPGGSAWPLALGGAIDVPGQAIDVRVTTQGHQQSPIDIRYRVTDYLGRPRWGVTALFSQLPLLPLMGIVRNMGWGIPSDLNFDGMAQGAVGYSPSGGVPRMDGAVSLANSTLSVGGTPPLRIDDAQLRFTGPAITLAPAVVENDRKETATLEASFDVQSGTLAASLSTGGMAIDSLRRQISVAGAPLLSQAIAGTWSGSLRYSSPGNASPGKTHSASMSQPGGWSGEVLLKDTDIPFEAFAEPVHVSSGDATIDGAGVDIRRLVFTAGGIAGQGEYRYDPRAARPHRFRIVLPRASGSAIEKFLMPTLHRGNFLNYAFNFGRVPEPDWMRNTRADGTLQVGTLDLGDVSFSKVRSRILWDADIVRFMGLQAQLSAEANDATFGGAGQVNISDPR